MVDAALQAHAAAGKAYQGHGIGDHWHTGISIEKPLAPGHLNRETHHPLLCAKPEPLQFSCTLCKVNAH